MPGTSTWTRMAVIAVGGLLIAACRTVPSAPAAVGEAGAPADRAPTAADIGLEPAAGIAEPLPAARASSEFWKVWGDGRAEISGYEITTPRYGAARTGTLALIYVTEPLDRRTWIKDDAGDVPEAERIKVLKLNATLKFQTGIYPYSVMTSVFSPVDGVGRERFAPGKISLSAQEWCGHVYLQVHPKGDHFLAAGHSYFSSEGDSAERVATEPFTLYEDALLIQLRELDGPFADGGDWRGSIVPSLWSARKAHVPLVPVAGSITRATATVGDAPVTRFTARIGEHTRTFDVEQAPPRRILGWRTDDGEVARILGTDRLPYWQLNNPGDESHLVDLGLAAAQK